MVNAGRINCLHNLTLQGKRQDLLLHNIKQLPIRTSPFVPSVPTAKLFHCNGNIRNQHISTKGREGQPDAQWVKGHFEIFVTQLFFLPFFLHWSLLCCCSSLHKRLTQSHRNIQMRHSLSTCASL